MESQRGRGEGRERRFGKTEKNRKIMRKGEESEKTGGGKRWGLGETILAVIAGRGPRNDIFVV